MKTISFLIALFITSLAYGQTTTITKSSKTVITSFESLKQDSIHLPGSKFFLKGSWGKVYTVRAVFKTESGRIVYKTDKHKFNADSCDFIVSAISNPNYAFSIYKD